MIRTSLFVNLRFTGVQVLEQLVEEGMMRTSRMNGLAARDIRRVELDSEGRVSRQERLRFPWRIRDVVLGPDGNIYALTDGNRWTPAAYCA